MSRQFNKSTVDTNEGHKIYFCQWPSHTSSSPGRSRQLLTSAGKVITGGPKARRERFMFIKSRFLVLSLCLAGFVLAQDRGTIRGVVTDPSGGTVPEATVTVKNINTGLTQTVKTSADGVYSVLYLPAGDYTVTTEKPGFRKSETSGIAVHVATVDNVDVTLAVGSVDQSVDVTAATPLLDLQGTNLGKVIPKNAIRDLDRKSTRLNSSHLVISYAVFCL